MTTVAERPRDQTTWEETVQQFPIGRELDARIKKHLPFGSLFDLEGVAQGFIDAIELPMDLGPVGNSVRVKVVDHRRENQQVRLVPVRGVTRELLGQLGTSWMRQQPKLEQELSEFRSWFNGHAPEDQERAERLLEQLVQTSNTLRDVMQWGVPAVMLREDFRDQNGELMVTMNATATPLLLLQAVRAWRRGEPFLPNWSSSHSA